MVQIVQGKRKQSFGEQFSTGIGNALNAGAQLSQQSQENKALKERYGLDLSDVRDPETRQKLITDQLTFGRKMKQAEASQGINYTKDLSSEVEPKRKRTFEEEFDPYQKKDLPNFGGEKLKGFGLERPEPTRTTGKGNLPEPTTEDNEFRLLNPREVKEEGLRISKQLTQSGTPTTPQQGEAIVLDNENTKATYLQNRDTEREKRVKSQREYGNIAVQKIGRLSPESSDEIHALFSKYGEQEAAKFESEADINESLALKAKHFKDVLGNIRNSKSPPSRIYNKIGRETRSAEQYDNDMRIKVKPLLDLGLYDTARAELSDIGLNVEEMENIVSNLGENAKKTLNNLPELSLHTKTKNFLKSTSDITKFLGVGFMYNDSQNLDKEEYEGFKNNIRDVFKNDSGVNVILLRKAYEDKGIAWNTYKDAINDLYMMGEIKLNEDQQKFLADIDQPPFGPLDNLLKTFKLIGR